MTTPPRFTLPAALAAARARRGPAHVAGLCGPYSSLCPACHRELAGAMLEHARRQLTPPLPGEDAGDYWHRMGQPFYDPWYETARAMGAEPIR